MTVPALNRISCVLNIANTSKEHFVTQNGLSATVDKALESTPDQIIDNLIRELELFTKLDTIPKEPPLKLLKQRARTYFKGKLKKSTPKMCMLFLSLFPLAKARWKLAKGLSKDSIVDKNSEQGYKLLKGKPTVVEYEDLNTLVFPRDTFFLVQELKDWLLSLSLLQLEICKRLAEADVAVLRIERDKDDELYIPELYFDYPQSPLYDQVKIVSKQLLERPDRIEKTVEPILKRLAGHEHCEKYLKVLELNELIAKREYLLDDWERQSFGADTYTTNEYVLSKFSALSHKPRKTLAFLKRLGDSFTTYLQKTLEASVKDTLKEQKRVSEHILRMVRQFEQDPQVELYKNITRRLKPLIQRFLSDDRETARDYTELAVLTEDYADGHPEYEYYVWTDVTPQTYQKQAERLKSYTQLDELDVTKTFKKVTAPVTPQRADRGFGVTIPARHTGRCLPKKKKPTKEEPVVTKPKPVVCATCDIEEIIVTLAKVTLHVEPLPTPPEPVITAKANLRYAMNVLRWRPSYLQHDDPIKSDPKYHHKSYTPRDRLWIYIKHNFATIVDDFLHLGVYEKDPKKLEFYNAVRRLQLVGDITIQQGRRKDRKVGVFTFTEGHDGTWKHRYFTIKSKAEEIIDQTYAEKGWKLLENPKEQAKDGQKPDLLAKDGSFVEYQSENMIIIRDPKNHNALIRIVPNRA